MSHRVAVLGATGYAGRELISLIGRHPRLELAYAACRADAGKTLDQLMPGAPSQPLCALEDVTCSQLDTVFLCMPHGASAPWAYRAWQAGCRVIDLSADFRLVSPDQDHPYPELLQQAVYGLTELARQALPQSQLIANPGCYPSSVLLGLAPLLKAGYLKSGTVISDSKSGVSGAGRAASVANLFGEVAENVRPYQVGDQHRHRQEMNQQMAAYGGGSAQVLFVPQVVPCFRGMISSLYVDWQDHWDLRTLYQQMYHDEAFVQLLPQGEVATMAHSRGSNRCVISLHPLPQLGKLLILSSLDNLLKGAAGQALQNLNAAQGWPESEGLPRCGS